MNNPKLSVVVPTFNRGRVLARTLPTILNQQLSPEDFEVVVVVDGSSDGTRDLLHALQPFHSGLRVVEQANSGQTVALMCGVAAARGDFVLFLDDDMLCPPTLIAEHLTGHRRSGPAVVFGQVLISPEKAADIPAASRKENLSKHYSRVNLGENPTWPYDACVGPNCSVPRATLLAHGGYDDSWFPRRMEDVELGHRLWRAGVAFRFAPRAITQDLCVKSVQDVVHTDTVADAIGSLALCRRHPEYRPYSPIIGMFSEKNWKRLLRSALVRAPISPDPILDLVYRVVAKFASNQRVRRAGARLLEIRAGNEFFRAVRREAGGWRALRSEFGLRLPVLLYHHVGPPQAGLAHPELTIQPREFEAQVRWLAHRGYKGITASEWLAWRQEGKPLPEKPVLITFDDAYADVAEYALPVLRRFGFTAAVFVMTDMLGARDPWENRQLMTASQIREWAAKGIEFGGHTRTHPNLKTVSDDELDREISGCAGDLAAIMGFRPVSFAYPFGEYDGRVQNAARRVFQIALTCDEGVNDLRSDPLTLRRTMIQPGDWPIDFRFRVWTGRIPLTSIRSRLRVRSRFRSALRLIGLGSYANPR